MPEALFYHLEPHPLERALPQLLERTLERDWRAIVRAGSEERLAALDAHLWTYTAESFLPHGLAADGLADAQPVLLTLDNSNPNGANVLFLVDGVPFEGTSGYDRVVYLFDGRDADARGVARQGWQAAKAAGFDVTYWQQEASGRWVKKA